MPTMNSFNILGFRCLTALVDNNFVVGHAAIDLGANQVVVSNKLTQLKGYSNVELFTYHPKPRFKSASIKGLTVAGEALCLGCRQILELIDNGNQ